MLLSDIAAVSSPSTFSSVVLAVAKSNGAIFFAISMANNCRRSLIVDRSAYASRLGAIR